MTLRLYLAAYSSSLNVTVCRLSGSVIVMSSPCSVLLHSNRRLRGFEIPAPLAMTTLRFT